jgi:hypothetical protein
VRLDAQLFQHQRHLPDGPVVTYPLAEPEPLSLDAGLGAGFAGPYGAEQVAVHADEAHQFGFQREQCVVFLLGRLPVERGGSCSSCACWSRAAVRTRSSRLLIRALSAAAAASGCSATVSRITEGRGGSIPVIPVFGPLVLGSPGGVSQSSSGTS